MKLLSFLNDQNEERLGLWHNGQTYDLAQCAKKGGLSLPSNMDDFLQDVDASIAGGRDVLNLIKNDHRLKPSVVKQKLAPVPRPPSCRDAYAFRQHVQTMRHNRGAEMIPEFDMFPAFYFTNHRAIVGEGTVFVQNDHLDQLDYELEVALVIGKKGRNILARDAHTYILGYTIMNDFSARRLQMEEMKLNLGPAKGKDFATSMGPWLVTPDELTAFEKDTPRGKTYDLRLSAKLNGKLMSEGNMSSMHWTFAEIIERVSYGVDLYPGDVIGSGTVGTGCLGELNGTAARRARESHEDHAPIWLKPGDEISLQIETMGTLSNTIELSEAPYSILR